MPEIKHEIKNIINSKKEILRRKFLMKLLKDVSEGKFNASDIPGDSQDQPSPRKPYISPSDRGTRNYGYMTVDEMMGSSPNYK